MTWFDYVVIVVLVTSIVVSAVRGLVREMLSLLAWIVAFWVANHFAAALAGVLPAAVPGESLRLIVAFIAIMVGTLIVGALVNLGVAAMIRAAGLQLADRGLGGLFGFARGVLIVLTGVILAGLTTLPQQPVWRDALFAPLAVEGVRTIKPFLPEAWRRHVHF